MMCPYPILFHSPLQSALPLPALSVCGYFSLSLCLSNQSQQQNVFKKKKNKKKKQKKTPLQIPEQPRELGAGHKKRHLQIKPVTPLQNT